MKAKFVHLIYKNPSNDFCIGVYMAEVDDEIRAVMPNLLPNVDEVRVIIKGIELPTLTKVQYEYIGKWEQDKKHGIQFHADAFFAVVPDKKNDIIEFLASPLINGVGVRTATKIYEMFGDDTFHVIEFEYEKLTKIKGIKMHKAESIRNSFIESKAVNDIYKLLGSSFNFGLASKIYNAYKEKSISIIQKQPYRLMRFHGVSFKMCDELGQKYLNNHADSGRIVGAGQLALDRYAVNGSSCMPINAFLAETMKLLNTMGIYKERVTKEEVLTVVGKFSAKSCDEAVASTAFIYQEKCIFKQALAKSEQYIARKLKRMLLQPVHCNGDLDSYIWMYERDNNITLDELQKKAIKGCFTSNINIVTGGPGTGKSTIVKAVIYLQKMMNAQSSITLLAPTGRAAKRLKETTGHFASTIHSALCIRPEEENDNTAGAEVKLDTNVVIVDEMSMTDMFIMEQLCHAIEDNTRLILVGDEEQLPSVGIGNVLHDLIHSDVIPVVKLQSIFRQKDGSAIIENAMRVNTGDVRLVTNKEFCFVSTNNKNQREEEVSNHGKFLFSTSVDKIVELYRRAVNTYGIDDVSLLVPYRKFGFNCVNNLNKILQKSINETNYNGPTVQFKDRIFLLNDRVMQIKNIRAEDEAGASCYVSNGDIGYVEEILCDMRNLTTNTHQTRKDDDAVQKKEDEILMIVNFDGVRIGYTKEMLEFLELAYCSTVHKSQGSEYRCVLFCVMNEHTRMLKRRILYTGITRGKECVCLIGEVDAIQSSIRNDKEDAERKTMLIQRLQGMVA